MQQPAQEAKDPEHPSTPSVKAKETEAPVTVTTGLPSPFTCSQLPSPQEVKHAMPHPEAGHDPASSTTRRDTCRWSWMRWRRWPLEPRPRKGGTRSQRKKNQRLKGNLEKAIGDGQVGVATPLGQKFGRECAKDDQMKRGYAAFDTDKQRARFKFSWANRQLSKLSMSDKSE